ncbi:MAG TPA: hypothetical protein VK419_06555 [Bryobacteraceae bacterium]|nr:hypothetical protein [Bryobacteraceae bacterium]
MSMTAHFNKLVKDLDQKTLEELRRSVASEMEGRRRKTSIKIADIHPGMSEEDKERAAEEIARVLEGDRG